MVSMCKHICYVKHTFTVSLEVELGLELFMDTHELSHEEVVANLLWLMQEQQ